MNKPLIIISGPCVVESRDMLFETAGRLIEIVKGKNIEFYFKSSYRKANRTSLDSFSGIGDETALSYLRDVRNHFGCKILTDVHSVSDVALASDYVDVLQIPAFLCRQTDIIKAVENSGKKINIKKGQFVAPEDMLKAARKASSLGDDNIWLTERGTFFGYHDLVVDFRSMIEMKKFGYKIIYDATHSVQQPSQGEQSGGRKEFIVPLAKAALAVGADGIFFETHPNPDKALSDSATQLPLVQAETFITEMLRVYEAMG